MQKSDLKNKYKFLSSKDIDLIYLLAKYKIKYYDIKKLRKREFKIFIKKYIKQIKKLNDKKNICFEPFISEEDINTLFYVKKNNISEDEIFKLLNINLNISIYPNTKFIIKKTKANLLKNKIINIISFLFSFIILTHGIFSLYIWFYDNKKINDLNSKVVKEVKTNDTSLNKTSSNKINFENLIRQNSDTVGWIKVNGTDIDYPFVQANNNNYYLNHSFDKSSNSKGWIFLDYKNSINNLSKNTIIYGHGLVNNMMFGSMRKIIKKPWYENKENHIVTIITPEKVLKWQVFSTYTIAPEDYYIKTNFLSSTDFNKFINIITERSLYNYGVIIGEDDKILTLSSCYNNSKRMVLHAKLISVN